MFNGQDLTGWVLVNTPAATWSVQDQMLICSGRPIGEIRTDRMYQNFILEVEWRHMVPGGNAGIFVWADDITAPGVPFHRSVEVQVLENAYGQSSGHTTHGDIFPIHGARMTPVNGRGGSRAFPTEERSKPSPEWNHYRIECRDGAISLAVNGKVVTRGSDASPRKGYICIESEGGVVHYRNLKIQELPDTPVSAEQVAVAARGFRSLYTGLNLDGWDAAEAVRGHWQVQDWVLSYDGLSPAPATLTSSELLADREFIVDVRPGKGFQGLTISGRKLQREQLQADGWSRIVVSVRDGRMSLSVNGRLVGEPTSLAADQTRFSISAAGAAGFANLYGRSLSGPPAAP
ncbi:MAG: DUF1080 domain-containing protein [Planctomycetota bacterium]